MRKLCDFNNSYMTFTVPNGVNTARIQLDSLTRVTNERTGKAEDFFQITPCKSEYMYAGEKLLQQPNFDFSGVFSRDASEIHRSWKQHDSKREIERHAVLHKDRFESVRFDIRTFKTAKKLKTSAEVHDATWRMEPIWARTHVRSAKAKRSAVIEYPVRTMNVRNSTRDYQVDTGPILFPRWMLADDKPATRKHEIQQFLYAFIVYYKWDEAEVVLRVPTRVDLANGKPGPEVWHYSRIEKIACEHELFVVK